MNSYFARALTAFQAFQRRKGTVTVELAVVLPIIAVSIMGSVEMGRAVMVRHVLEETARAGCRVAALENGQKTDVQQIISAAMTRAGISNYTWIVDPDPPESLDAFEPVTVTVSVDYADVSWLASTNFMAGKTLEGVCVMPAEGDGANDPDANQTPSAKKNKKNKKNKKAKKAKKNKKTAKKTVANKKTGAKKNP